MTTSSSEPGRESAGAAGSTPDRVSNLNVPNALTVLRILMVPVLGWMLIAFPDDDRMRIWTTVVFCVAMLTDLIDGYLARRFRLITSFGKIADPIADKAMTGMALVGLSVIGELWWWITIVILVREWGVTLMRFALLRFGEVQAANKGGKIKTVVQTAAIILFLLPLPQLLWGVPLQPLLLVELVSWILMFVALALTVVSGIDYVRAAIRLVRTHEAKKFAATDDEPRS